jgi:hypothetical protein
MGGLAVPELFEGINKKILEWNAPRPSGARGGCSLATLWIDDKGYVTAANAGATGVGLVRNGRCLALLAPQSPPRLSAGMPLVPDQALGLMPGILPETRSFFAMPGDLLFLGSSGLEWEGEAFQTEIVAHWSIHLPGDNIAPLAEILVQTSPSDWNSAFLGIEIN